MSKVLETLWVGSAPMGERDVGKLASVGVSAVLNLQEDEDFETWGVDWPRVEAAYEKKGIEIYRYPIRDFDVEDLAEKVEGAVELLTELLGRHTVYVHCTAGINRSPTVSIAYLMRAWNMALPEAVKFFRERHYAEPYVQALERMRQPRLFAEPESDEEGDQ